jgi:hypothetical protein
MAIAVVKSREAPAPRMVSRQARWRSRYRTDEDLHMRRRSVRMTLRGMMVAVAIVAVVLGVGLIKKRRDECLKRLMFWSGWEHKYTARAQARTSGRPGNAEQERLDHFRAMRRKWEWAASHPWESVEPDPP